MLLFCSVVVHVKPSLVKKVSVALNSLCLFLTKSFLNATLSQVLPLLDYFCNIDVK